MKEEFNIHSLPFLFTSLIFLVLPLYIFIKNKKSQIARTFFILGLVSFVWYFPYFIIYNLSSVNSSLIIFFLKIAYLGLVFIGPSLYRFTLSFLNLKKKYLVYLFYTVSIIFAILIIFTDYIVSGFREFSWGYSVMRGKYYSMVFVIWIIPLFLSLKELYVEYKKTKY
ncbi:MAG: hypothetical protein NC925_04860, partial [Candidatus Omnitrophica bacterium]|nr:hypothetical protein [Candidatus Omnitrophota bacterium]